MYRKVSVFCLLLPLGLGLVSCRDVRKAYSSGPRLAEVQKVRTAYQAKDYDEAKKLIEELFRGSYRTGDLAFYYGKTLDVLSGSASAPAEVVAAYEEATNWFGTYASEFPEDQNRDKAYYNLGVMYVRRSPVQDLHRAKAIWDESKRQGADAILNRENQYKNLVFQIPLFDAEMVARRLRDGLEKGRSDEDFKNLDSDFRKNLKNFRLKPYLEREGVQPSDLLVELLRRWDDILAERRKELGLP